MHRNVAYAKWEGTSESELQTLKFSPEIQDAHCDDHRSAFKLPNEQFARRIDRAHLFRMHSIESRTVLKR